MYFFSTVESKPVLYSIYFFNESTAGADASVEALKLYHMKLTLAYSSLLALLVLVACQTEWQLALYKKWAVIVAKKSSKSTNGRARL